MKLLALNSLAATLSAMSFGCAADPGESPAAVIERALTIDAQASHLRNHACETAPIADAVRGYVAALDAINLDGAPQDFVAALQSHRDAWLATLPWMDAVAADRGEMHQLLDRIKARDQARAAALEPLMKQVFATWTAVDAATANAGARVPGS